MKFVINSTHQERGLIWKPKVFQSLEDSTACHERNPSFSIHLVRFFDSSLSCVFLEGSFVVRTMSWACTVFCCQQSQNVVLIFVMISLFFVDASLESRLSQMCVCASVKLWLHLKKKKTQKWENQEIESRFFCVALRAHISVGTYSSQ